MTRAITTQRRSRIVGTGIAALAVAVVAGCGSSGGSPPSTGTGPTGPAVSTLVIANAVKVDTLDPEANSVNESIWLDQNLYSRLLQPNSTGTGLLPDLASSWKIAPDGLTYTFNLRPDAKFSNGTPVTASDVVYSIERSRAFSGGWGFLLTAVKTITAPDAHTVVITLSEPHAPLLADLAMYAYSVVPESLVKSQGSQFFQHPVGSGPFMVTSYSPDSEVDLAANPNFYGTKPKIKKVRVLIVPNDNTRVLMLESKKADIIENPPGNLIQQIDANSALSVKLFPSTRVDFIQLDEHFKPFKSQLVREALNYAINRKSIVSARLPGARHGGRVVHAVQDAVLRQQPLAVPVQPDQGQAAAGPGGLPARVQRLPDHGQRRRGRPGRGDRAQVRAGLRRHQPEHPVVRAADRLQQGGQRPLRDGRAVLDQRHHRPR